MTFSLPRFVLLAALIALAFVSASNAETPWLATHGLTQNELSAWVKAKPKDYRLVYVNGYDAGKLARYAALAIKDETNPAYYWWIEFLDDVKKKDAQYRAEGFRAISAAGFLGRGAKPRFAVIWIKDGRPAREKIAFHLTLEEFTQRLKLEKSLNYVPNTVNGYGDGSGSYRFTALFVPAGKTEWEAQPDLTEAQYEKALQQGKTKGFRPNSVSVYPTPAGLRFALVSVKDGLPYREMHRAIPAIYQNRSERLRKAGFHPVSVAGYVDGTPARPEDYDLAVQSFMEEHEFTAGTFAVSRDGKLFHAGAQTHSEASGLSSIDSDTPMRLGGVTRTITAAAIHTLVREGKLSLDTKAFPLLGLKPAPGQQPDPRLNDITIRHLLEHEGGWDFQKTFDPMFRCLDIAHALNVPAPVGPVDIIRYMMGQPLQFDPGKEHCFSNFGYCVLGRVIEKISGQTYLGYVRQKIFEPLGATSLALARTLPRHRNPREPRYFDLGKGRSVFSSTNSDMVPVPDGAHYLEGMDAACGLIASSRDMVRFLDAYWISGTRREGEAAPQVIYGDLPGTYTMLMQRPNGVNIAACFNQRLLPSARENLEFRDVMQEIADRHFGGRLRYAAVWVKDE